MAKLIIEFDQDGSFNIQNDGLRPGQIYLACSLIAESAKQGMLENLNFMRTGPIATPPPHGPQYDAMGRR